MSDLDKFRSGGDSKYNSSLDSLMRINRLIEYAELGSFQDGLQGIRQWRNALSALQREVKPYCTDAEVLLLCGGKNKIGEIVTGLEVLRVPDPGVAQRLHMNVDLEGLRLRLTKWEDALRILIAKKGMGLKTGSDPRNAL